mmetsp:Transcript_33865/g.85013  ORF Transcript_33865/g.85013 Transcript_33865/m.85013 type:complete len:234 (+) Transcript_33865:1184-1885(+)
MLVTADDNAPALSKSRWNASMSLGAPATALAQLSSPDASSRTFFTDPIRSWASAMSSHPSASALPLRTTFAQLVHAPLTPAVTDSFTPPECSTTSMLSFTSLTKFSRSAVLASAAARLEARPVASIICPSACATRAAASASPLERAGSFANTPWAAARSAAMLELAARAEVSSNDLQAGEVAPGPTVTAVACSSLAALSASARREARGSPPAIQNSARRSIASAAHRPDAMTS